MRVIYESKWWIDVDFGECRHYGCRSRNSRYRQRTAKWRKHSLVATGRIPAWFFHEVSSCDLRVSSVRLLRWSQVCSCYSPLVVLKSETSENL